MKNKNLFVKIVFIVLIVLLLLSLIVPVIFSQTAPKKETLLNGLKVLMWSDAKADKVSVKIRIHAGSAFDPQGKEGVMQVLADNLFPNDASREFFAEDLGGSLEVVTNYDYIQVNASAKPDQLLTMLETLAGAVSNPAIDKETTVKLRSALIGKVKTLESDPAYVADRAVAKRLFGTFPYGRAQAGTEASLQKIEYADLVEARQRFLTADNATIAVSGNFDRSLALRAIKRYFGGWLKADKRVPSTFRQPDEPPVKPEWIVSQRPGVTEWRFAVRGTARGDKDFAASELFARIISSRLKAALPAGRSNVIAVSNQPHVLPGIIVVSVTASGDAIDEKDDAGDAIANALIAPFTATELDLTRAAAKNEWMRRDAATVWLDAETFGGEKPELSNSIFDGVTLADLQAYAERVRKLPMVMVAVTTRVPAK